MININHLYTPIICLQLNLNNPYNRQSNLNNSLTTLCNLYLFANQHFAGMGEAHQIRDQELPYFLTFQVVRKRLVP
jgi:hypothetical protein